MAPIGRYAINMSTKRQPRIRRYQHSNTVSLERLLRGADRVRTGQAILAIVLLGTRTSCPVIVRHPTLRHAVGLTYLQWVVGAGLTTASHAYAT